MQRIFSTLLLSLLCATASWAQVQLTLSPDDYGVSLTPSPYGIFF